MKLLMYKGVNEDKTARLAAVLGETVIDLNMAYAWLLKDRGQTEADALAHVQMPTVMDAFIENSVDCLPRAQDLLDTLQAKDLSGLDFVQPLQPELICCPLQRANSLRDFITFEAHIKRGYDIRQKPFPEEWYKRPVYYKGNARTIIGPNEVVHWPVYTEKLDYELEYACVIGQGGINLDEDAAWDAIFGFTILNDFSARDIQFKEMTCRLGPAKGKDFASSIGPYIVTKDEIPDVMNLTMTARVNGEEWSRGNSGTGYWNWKQIVAYASLEEMLYPTDVMGSGTVGGGCGYELDRWIQVGDDVELEVEHLGVLRNTIAPKRQVSQGAASYATSS